MIIYRVISEPGHGIEVVNGMNATDKRFIFKLMATVQLTDSERFDKQMAIHKPTHNADVSLAQ